MKRTRSVLIGDIVRRYLREEGLETPLNEYRLVNSWEETVGRGVAAYTRNIYIRNQVLYVHVDSPALRQNLQMCREQLVNRLNQNVGAQIIVDIVFH